MVFIREMGGLRVIERRGGVYQEKKRGMGMVEKKRKCGGVLKKAKWLCELQPPQMKPPYGSAAPRGAPPKEI